MSFQCEPISGLGFRRGSYKCVCRIGYYFPDAESANKFFDGTTLEEEYAKRLEASTSELGCNCRKQSGQGTIHK